MLVCTGLSFEGGAMHLVSLVIQIDLEPEVPTIDRERILRRLKNQLRSDFGHRVTVSDDNEVTLAVAFFDENYERAKHKIDKILERVEFTGEARIANVNSKIFAFYEGEFRETGAKRSQQNESDRVFDNKTIRYQQDDDDDNLAPLSPLPTRYGKRQLRIPARK